jgi:MFS transporter, DHA1 family, multidrug resistance protein
LKNKVVTNSRPQRKKMSQQTTKPTNIEDSHQPRPITLNLILILGILSAYGPITIDLYMPALPTIGQEFQTDRIQQTMSVYFLGMALGQLFMGPLSDKFGRKRPLLFGCALYALASLGCALSPSLEALLLFRFLQALGGCAGMVLTVSMVRDLFAVKDSARVFSYLVLVMGLAPILAPLVGGQLLLYSGWRVIFLILMGFGLLCFVMVAVGLPESLPLERRNKMALANLASNYRGLLTDLRFTAYALPSSFIGAGFTVYLASAALVFIEVYGVAPQHFGWIFGLNAVGLIGMSQVNAWLLRRYSSDFILNRATFALMLVALALLVLAITGFGGMIGLWIALFFCVGGSGLIRPNATARAMAPFPEKAGSASALLNSVGAGLGALTGYFVSLFHAKSALPMALMLALCYVVAWLLLLAFRQFSKGRFVVLEQHGS